MALKKSLLVREFGGVCDDGPDMFGFERRVTAQNFFVRCAFSETIQNIDHLNAGPFGAQLSVTDLRIMNE